MPFIICEPYIYVIKMMYFQSTILNIIEFFYVQKLRQDIKNLKPNELYVDKDFAGQKALFYGKNTSGKEIKWLKATVSNLLKIFMFCILMILSKYNVDNHLNLLHISPYACNIIFKL